MTDAHLRFRMKRVEAKAAALGVALYDLIEELDNYYHSKHLDFQMSERGQVVKENLDRLERWHETAVEVDAAGLILE